MNNNKSKTKYIHSALFLFYLFTVLWFTVLARTKGISIAHFGFFWSFREWLNGNWQVGRQILANVAMFIPFGYLLSLLLFQPKADKPKAGPIPVLITFLCALAFSGLIETMQLLGMRGTFEPDDLLSNTLGALVGLALFRLTGGWKRATTGILAFVFVVCAGVMVIGGNWTSNESDTLPKAFCFQTETAENREGAVLLTGVAFRYNRPEWTGTIVLRSTETGEEIPLQTEQTERPEVNAYFLCKTDYTGSGFRASGNADPDKEYEIMIRFPFSVLLSTGEYLTGERIHYAPDRDFREPETAGTELEEIIRDGTLRVYRPDRHCWVYQKDRKLYWIAEDGFIFEEDGKTYIQYHLWTTQTEKLPEKRLSNNWYWDNISGSFEKYELKGDFGKYRVCCREIPEEYSITTIMTGYYKNREWIWKEYFRPVYAWPGNSNPEE